MSIQQSVWNYFLNKGFTPQGIAGMMGNMQIESKFVTNNLEDGKLPYTDAQYTAMVDNGNYTNFVYDGCGYGLVQWTYSVFKQDLLNLCRSREKSISDLQCQLDQLYLHLQSEKLLNTIKNATSIDDVTLYFMNKFEKPSEEAKRKTKDDRIKYAKEFYKQFTTSKGGNGMKYNTSNPPLVCMQTNSTCYKGTSKMQVKGVLWHSTGANNTTIKRYVQPSDNDPNKGMLLAKIGKNTGGNDWNHISMQAGLNAWIGTLADGSVAAVQTMPWDYKPWGCGSGSRGTCNNGWIQFEICEDNLTNGTYFLKVYQEACELTAYLCKLYNLNPNGSTNFNGIQVPVILCHSDSAQLGLGSNHADIYHWFSKYGKSMVDVRKDVAALLSNSNINTSTNTNTINTSTSSGLLQKGDEGPEVEKLQQALIKLGYSVGSYGADGDFGKATEAAVIKFQQDHKLDDDGVVGELTWAVINNALKNSIPTNEIYRVRMSWDQPSSQVGAYKNLNSAKAAVDALGSKYHVYNSKGEEIYPSATSSNNQTASSTVLPSTQLTQAKTYADVVLASASKDERGQYTGGIPGDQTGKEVHTLNWYNQNWNYVLRPATANLAEKIARAAEAGCANNNIGYSQSARNTIYIEAQKVGLDLAKITTPCNCDCASFVSTCCICAGLPASIFYAGSNMRTTYNMVDACRSTNSFNILSGNMYTNTKDYLKRGDILLNSNQHVVIVLQDGIKAEKTQPVTNSSSSSSSSTSFQVRINTLKLNVRKAPSNTSGIVTTVSKNYVFTIVEEKEGWGRLKSGAGWIDLSYTIRV